MLCSPCSAGLALAALLAALAQAPVAAQPPPPASTPSRPSAADPLDARAAVPPVLHASALARYKPAGDGAVGSWREANDTVARIGGWKAYAREAQAAAPGGASAAPGASAASPASPAASTPAPAAPAARPGVVPGQPGPSGHPGHGGRH